MTDNPSTLPEPLRPLAVTLDELDTLEDAAAVHADVQAIADVVNTAQRTVRERLDELAFADAGTGGVTRRYGFGQVIVTDPKPKPTIVDDAAFEAWVELATDLEAVRRPRADVIDVPGATAALAALATAARDALPGEETVELDLGLVRSLLGSIAYGEETLVPASALDDLVASKRVKVTRAAAIDTDTGEAVPGVEVTVGKRTVQVKPDKSDREARAELVRENLARRPEVTA